MINEFKKAKAAGLDEILKSFTKEVKKSAEEEVVAPPKEVVTADINGIDIMDLEDACQELWKHKIYAESGMGCTGPIVLISEANQEKAIELLVKAGYVAKATSSC